MHQQSNSQTGIQETWFKKKKKGNGVNSIKSLALFIYLLYLADADEFECVAFIEPSGSDNAGKHQKKIKKKKKLKR